MRFKDGDTWETRSGVRRIISVSDSPYYPISTAPISSDIGDTELFDEKGRWSPDEKKHKWDLVRKVKNVKRN